MAIGLAERGASVVVASRTAAEVDAVCAEIKEIGGIAVAIPADLSDPNDIIRLLSESKAAFGPVAILVNNAAVVSPIGSSPSLDPDDWAMAIDVNVTAVARLSFSVLPEMLEGRWGRIVNVSSGIAAHPESMLRANAYATSKAALEAHTLNLAAELAGTGVTVNVYRPGGVDTAMQAWIRDQPTEVVGQEMHDRFVASKEGGTLLTPEESAAGLLPRIEGGATGQIWSVRDPL
jgi:NAD(P)-dependent dehydrogenase (short-subunit alcohol dehydrogenase family)